MPSPTRTSTTVSEAPSGVRQKTIISLVFLICVSLVGMAWGIFPAGMILVALLGVFGVVSELERGRMVATESSSAKSAFLAQMSHELRTPMNAIIGMSSLLVDTELESEQREYAETIHTSAHALHTLLDDILHFSKLEAGKIELESIDFDVRRVVDETLDLFSVQAEGKRLELSSEVDGDVPRALLGDPGRLRQILLNLVGNAIKFTEQGGVHVTVQHVASLGAGGHRLRVAVADTGIGIPRDRLDTLFQPFVQADASTTRRFGGTGLGLAIVGQLVGQMGGQVGVMSTEGRGSTFHFTLDLAESHAPWSVDSVDRIAPIVPRDAGSGAGQRVLVVEDNPVNQRVAQRMLERAGYAARIASSGAEALDRLAEGGFELVLMDCQMPGMDGYQVTARIRERERATGAHVPIVALTANAMHEDRERCLAAGMDAYLSKPIEYDRLCATLAEWLGSARAAG
jgi:signal transduction histidine kinase/CheY-like chemotaxis protein